MDPLSVAVVQFEHADADKSANLATIHRFAQDAAARGVRVLAFPEMCITGYWFVRGLSDNEIRTLAEPVPSGPSCRELTALAQEYDMLIGAGLIELAEDGKLYNTYVVALPDGTIQRHRKLHCFISKHMASGDAYTVFDTPWGWRVGVLICYDNNIIENARMTALQGADILLAPHQTGGCKTLSPHCMGLVDRAAWDARGSDPARIREELRGPKGRGWLMKWLPARAHDNGMFLLFSNGVGKDGDEIRTGNAMVLDCYGNVLDETDHPGEAMVCATLDPALFEHCTGRRWIRSRRPELYAPLTQPTGDEVDIYTARFGAAQDS